MEIIKVFLNNPGMVIKRPPARLGASGHGRKIKTFNERVERRNPNFLPSYVRRSLAEWRYILIDWLKENKKAAHPYPCWG